jgi:hypothetical protein
MDETETAETYLKQVEKIRQQSHKDAQQNWKDNSQDTGIKDSKKGK